jgi:hypothetical protein
MARRADAWIGPRLFRVPGHEAGAVQAPRADVVEGEPCGQSRHRPFAVTRRALSFRVATRAEIALTCGAGSVLAKPVAVVDEMVVGHVGLARQVDVAARAIAKGPLIAVLVAAEAGRHLREHGVGPRLGDLGVASHAVAHGGRHVVGVIEAELSPRELHRASHVAFAVAPRAWALIMGFAVATAAVGLRGKVQWPRVSRRLHPGVALEAVDPLEDVRSMLEWTRRRRPPQAEHARACGKKD